MSPLWKCWNFICWVCVEWSWHCHNCFLCVCVCVCLIPFLLLFLTLYMFLHLTTMHSCTFGKGWVGRGCLYLLVWMSFGSFSLRELTCMHCVYLVLWTCKVLCGSVLGTIIYKKNHSFIQNLVDACWICCGLYLSLPWREAGDVWCPLPVWNLRAVIWFLFPISSLVFSA